MTVTPVEPAILLQADATVIAGIFIFLTILHWTRPYLEYDYKTDIAEKKRKLKFPLIIIGLFAASACFTLVYPFMSYILTFGGFAAIVIAFVHWYNNPKEIPY
jgi:hypothetical protein